jgi:GNAT superfamily N-acetyltransferase
LNSQKDRSAAWIAKKGRDVVGSVLIAERPQNEAQLRLLFVAKSVRGIGLGRWLVEEAIRYSALCGFGADLLVDGCGFRPGHFNL